MCAKRVERDQSPLKRLTLTVLRSDGSLLHFDLCEHFMEIAPDRHVLADTIYAPVFEWHPVPGYTLRICRVCAYALRMELNRWADAVVHARR